MICSKCVLDDSVPELAIDENGICNYCKLHDKILSSYPSGLEGDKILKEFAEKVRKSGKNKLYDCIVGVSGGTDSTYTLWLTKKILGLRPLAVHFDNGWNTEIANLNIKKATDILDIDLITVVANWTDFRELQKAFLWSSTPDAEVPTDFAIISTLYKVAAKHGIKYIIEGQGSRAEGTTPLGWTYHDSRYIKQIKRKFSPTSKLRNIALMNTFQLSRYIFFNGIRLFRPLEYIDYSKEEAKKINKSELEWIDPGGHHHESIYTRFFQSYYLPLKFGIDKRKRELSAKIRSGVITRNEAIMTLSSPYPFLDEDITYVKKKLQLTDKEFDNILNMQTASFMEYSSLIKMMRVLRLPIRLAVKAGLLPEIIIHKYLDMDLKRIENYWKNYGRK